jgi:tetratricopeptide (TPR) repeat protein
MFGAEAAAQQAEQLIFLVGGRVFHGTVLESNWESVKISRKTEGGSPSTFVVPVHECDPHFFYQVRDKAVGNDAAERIKLAKYCVDHDMFSRAKAQMDRARSIDKAVVDEFMKNEFPKIKEELAQRLLDAGRRALRRGSTKNAKKYAAFVLTKFEGTKAEPEAEKLLDEVQAKLDEATAKKRAQRRKSEKANEERAARIEAGKQAAHAEPIEKLITEGHKANTRGLKAKNDSGGKSGFEAAATKFERAISRADKALKEGLDEGTAAHIKELRGEAVQGGVRAYINLASLYSTRGSYKDGTRSCNKALALDPDNAEAKSLRAEISTTGGGWGRRGGRR